MPETRPDDALLRTSDPRPTGELPSDLLRLSSNRLGIASLVWAGLWALGLVMNNVVGPILSPDAPLDDAWPWPGNPVAFAVIAVSLGVFWYTRRRASNPRLALDLGLAYEVVLAFAIGLVNQWTPNASGLSWICVLVLIHPMIVPSTRPRTLLAALAAASMDPLGIAITGARGVEIPSFPVILWTYLPNYVCAFLAIVPSHVISGLSRQVNEARELGSYRLGELLGKGGMGEVYVAHHRMLRRPAAIKLIRPDALRSGRIETPDTIKRRFQREAEAAAQLHSPHTVQLYDFGVTKGGQFYTVMELLRGLDLESIVERFGPIPPARTAYLLRHTCHSLGEAHAYGLVHRDIKPANIYACWVGREADYVKVLDFGLVKGDLGEGQDRTKLTAPEITTGTPAYMSPELARAEDIDGRSDLYALGCVAFFMLTGRLVFEAESPMKMMLAHIKDTPVPPSQLSEFPISRDLDEVVLSCLQKDRAQRPPTADELARRLGECDVGEPWTAEAAARWWHAHLPELAEPPARP
jgi:tRNA A-37 threonylcarbamoyl transferase component Bud32